MSEVVSMSQHLGFDLSHLAGTMRAVERSLEEANAQPDGKDLDRLHQFAALLQHLARPELVSSR